MGRSSKRKQIAQQYGADYFDHHCGVIYDRRQPLWLDFFGRVADEIVRSLRPKRVLDVGCAKGFLVECLRDRGVETYGFDISEYAIGQVRPDMRRYCWVASATAPIRGHFDLITCIEVVEHLSETDARTAIRNMASHAPVILFSSTPIDFKEPSHINVQPVIEWLRMFRDVSFTPDLSFDASFVSPQAMLLRRAKTRQPSDEAVTVFALAVNGKVALHEKNTEVGVLREESSKRMAEMERLAGALREAERERESLRGALREHDARQGEREVERHRLISMLAVEMAKMHELHEQAGQLRQEVQHLREQFTHAQGEAADRIIGLQNELRENKQDQETAISERDMRIASLESSSAKQISDIARLEAEVETYQNRLDALKSSLSWRITQPLRILRGFQLDLMRGLNVNRYRLIPGPDVVRMSDPGFWKSLNGDPWFLLDGRRAGGWVELAYKMESEVYANGSLYVDTGSGFSETERVPLPGIDRGEVRAIFHLPNRVCRLRIDPTERPGRFRFENLTIRPLAKWQVRWHFLKPFLRAMRRQPALGVEAYRKRQRGGLRVFKEWLISFASPTGKHGEFAAWVTTYDTITDAARQAISQRIENLYRQPRISVLMPVYNTEERWLRAALDSVIRQIYTNWELCIADDGSSQPHIRRILEEYQRFDQRIKVAFREKRGHISAASNSALEMVTGEFVALVDHDDELPEHALYMVAAEINKYPNAAIIYSDEDKIDEEGQRFDPYFKSDWNLDLFLGHNMISHLGVYRSQLIREVGGFREAYVGSQDYDLALRIIERVEPERIRHIPHILYHWRAIQHSAASNPEAKPYAYEAARRALLSYFTRNGIAARSVPSVIPYFHRALFALPEKLPTVSVIIPTRNGAHLLERCVECVRLGGYPNVEIIIVDNKSDESETLAYLNKLRNEGAVVIPYDKAFNYSEINNLAAARAKGEVLLFLNNDVDLLESGWLEELVRHAVRREVGAVGAALYYPDRRLQHGGVVLGLGPDRIAGHAHHGIPLGHSGYLGRAVLVQNLSAVTAACMATRREVFLEVHGFDADNLPVTFNDIDYCLRIRERGYLVVWTPYSRLYHHESATRGPEDRSPQGTSFAEHCSYMRCRWYDLLDHDPYYNPNLTLDRSNFGLAWPPRITKPWATGPVEKSIAAAR